MNHDSMFLSGNLDRIGVCMSKATSKRDFVKSRHRTGRDHGSATSISNGFEEQGGGGGSVTVDAETGCAESPGAASPAASSDDDDGGDGDGDPDRRRSSKKSPSRGKHRNATATAGALPSPQDPDIALWRLPTVLAHVPVSRSGWWAGVKAGRYPAPVRLSARCVAWRAADIRALIASF